MPFRLNTPNVFWYALLFLAAATGNVLAQKNSAANPPVTNLLQLVELLKNEERVVRDVRLEATVCAASDPAAGVLILQDATDVELVELGAGNSEFLPGEKIRIENKNCLLRRREIGVQISTAPVVDNDKIHDRTRSSGGIWLRAGRYPWTLEWFNQFNEDALEVSWQSQGASNKIIPDTAFSHASPNGSLQPGLVAEGYEGNWERVPDFDLLKPVKTGVVTNLDLNFQTQTELTGIRFQGFLNIATNGYYNFAIRSSSGSLLFIGNPHANIESLGKNSAPVATPAEIGETLENSSWHQWVSIEGQVAAVAPAGKGLDLDLRAERNSLRVHIADAGNDDLKNWLHARVRVNGVSCGVFDPDGRLVLGKLFVASGNDLELLAAYSAVSSSSNVLRKINDVQTLPLADAKRGLPVQIRGVVTSVGGAYDFWISVQDDTRGIFVDLHNASNSVPMSGDFYEIIGHSGAGDFAPVIMADQLNRLGQGNLPEPARPAWSALINGSMDVQWVEFQGLVTAVKSNTLSMLLPDGQIEVQVEGPAIGKLDAFEKTVVHIRGVLFAVWNATREVRVGHIVMRNATITMDIPTPRDPFDAVLKTPRELLLFDAQATAFHRVKVRGQIIHADANEIFLMEDGAGLRILPAEKTDVHPGDVVEAVGYPDIGGTALLLRETHLRKTGAAPLPPPKKLDPAKLTQEGLDSTRVLIEGKLIDWHQEHGMPVLEMQSGGHLYLARLTMRVVNESFSLRAGSRLALTGVYADQSRDQHPGTEAGSFELLINSPTDITILSQPSWWTLQRLLIIVGILLAILVFASAWITQLRRLIEQRTAELRQEIRERARIERQHELEAERSRIARDLHDDLGSSLTEINVLASTGLRHAEVRESENQSEKNPEKLNQKNNHTNLFNAIAAKARHLVAALDVIVWAVDPEDNSLQSLADYLCGYAGEYLTNSNIACRFKVPVTFPAVTLDGRVRHDLLLAVKETLNNIVRHARATEVEFRMAVAEKDLQIEIADNGKGFAAAERDGHGLKNLSARLTKLGGSCVVESRVGGGTTVKILLPLPSSALNVLSGQNQNTTFD